MCSNTYIFVFSCIITSTCMKKHICLFVRIIKLAIKYFYSFQTKVKQNSLPLIAFSRKNCCVIFLRCSTLIVRFERNQSRWIATKRFFSAESIHNTIISDSNQKKKRDANSFFLIIETNKIYKST